MRLPLRTSSRHLSGLRHSRACTGPWKACYSTRSKFSEPAPPPPPRRPPPSPRNPTAPQWSSLTAILLATLTGATAYAFGARNERESSNNSSSNSSWSFLPSPDPSQKDFDSALQCVRRELGDDDLISVDKDELFAYGSTEWSYHAPSCLPGAVIYPRSTEDVVKIVKIANKYSIPIVPVSGATSLEGHFNAPNTQNFKPLSPYDVAADNLPKGRGFALSFSQNMSSIISIHENDLDAIVQPGVSYEQLNKELDERGTGLFFPVDPGPGAQIGGMVATGCSGTNAVRYGTMRENVINVTVVLANGEIMKTRQRSKKSAAGPDIGKLIIGSEGTLGIITEATLKLQPKLAYSAVGVSSFDSVEKAADAVCELVKSGVGLQCIELLDEVMMSATNKQHKHNNNSKDANAEKPSLFLKFGGPTQDQVDSDIKLTKKILSNHNGSTPKFASSDREKEELWYARKVALWSAMELVPGCRCWTTDVCVPISKLPQLVTESKKDFAESGLIAPIVGHAGDGNFHALLLISNEKELEIARQIVSRMVDRAQKLDGTCTGEHGVGIGKVKYLVDELGDVTVGVMVKIKKALDPKNIMNPGKLYPSK